MSAVRLLADWQVARVRAGLVEYGDIKAATVARASTCRCCGQKMAKGTEALRFAWDFTGSGSWTATTCVMHPACAPAIKTPHFEALTAALPK